MVSRVVEGRNIVDSPTGKVMYLIKTRRKKKNVKKNATIAVDDLIDILKRVSLEPKSDTKKTERRWKIEPDIHTILRVNI